jgi:hypothetical protein
VLTIKRLELKGERDAQQGSAMPGAALRVVNTLESESAGITGTVDSPLDPGVNDIVSEPVDDAGVTVRVDVPVLFLGAPRIFAVPAW